MADLQDKFENALAQAEGVYEPQRQFQWILRIPNLEGGEIMELSLRSGAAPSESNEEITIPYMNGNVYVAGKQSYETGSFSYTDYVDKNTAAVIGKWRDLVHDPATHKIGYAAVYKKNADLIMYGPDFSVERIWKLRGMWPQQVNFGTLDYSSSETVQIEVTFRYDFAIRHKGF